MKAGVDKEVVNAMFQGWQEHRKLAESTKVVVTPAPHATPAPAFRPQATPARKGAGQPCPRLAKPATKNPVDEPLPAFTVPTSDGVQALFGRPKPPSSTTLASDDCDATLLEQSQSLVPVHVVEQPDQVQSVQPSDDLSTSGDAGAEPTEPTHGASARTPLPEIPKDVLVLVHPKCRCNSAVVQAACQPGFVAFVHELRSQRDDDGYRFGKDMSELQQLLKQWEEDQQSQKHKQISHAVKAALLRPDTKELDEGARPMLQPKQTPKATPVPTEPPQEKQEPEPQQSQKHELQEHENLQQNPDQKPVEPEQQQPTEESRHSLTLYACTLITMQIAVSTTSDKLS